MWWCCCSILVAISLQFLLLQVLLDSILSFMFWPPVCSQGLIFLILGSSLLGEGLAVHRGSFLLKGTNSFFLGRSKAFLSMGGAPFQGAGLVL